MSLFSHFYYSGIAPMVALFLLLLQLLLTSNVTARPGGQVFLGDDKRSDCDTFINDNADPICRNEAYSKYSGPSTEVRCKFELYVYKCNTEAACATCTSDSLTTWIHSTQQAMDKWAAATPKCQQWVSESPTLVCPTTIEPPSTIQTSSTTIVTTTTGTDFPLWMIVPVIVAVVALIGFIVFMYFVCRTKPNTPNNVHKSSQKMGISAQPVPLSTNANNDKDATGGGGYGRESKGIRQSMRTKKLSATTRTTAQGKSISQVNKVQRKTIKLAKA